VPPFNAPEGWGKYGIDVDKVQVVCSSQTVSILEGVSNISVK
jgi:hypothetical protein